jgi:hypothetical protein
MWLKRDSRPKVNQLPLPALLVELMSTGRWKQPSDEQIRRAVPFLLEPVNFLLRIESMRFESKGHIADDPRTSILFQEYRSGRDGERDLPWLDTDESLFIAVNRELGADLGVALDYRTSIEDPRVVASDWWTDEHRCNWRQVEARFSDFVEKMEF